MSKKMNHWARLLDESIKLEDAIIKEKIMPFVKSLSKAEFKALSRVILLINDPLSQELIKKATEENDLKDGGKEE